MPIRDDDGGAAATLQQVNQNSGAVLPAALTELITEYALPPLATPNMLCEPDPDLKARATKIDWLLAEPEALRPEIHLCGPGFPLGAHNAGDDDKFDFPVQIISKDRKTNEVTLLVNLRDERWSNYFGGEQTAGLRELRIPLANARFVLQPPPVGNVGQRAAFDRLVAVQERLSSPLPSPAEVFPHPPELFRAQPEPSTQCCVVC